MDIKKQTSFLTVRRADLDGKPSVKLIGPFDSLSDIALNYAKEIVSEGHKELAIDMSETTYMTSQGIACIIKMLKLLKSDKYAVYVYGANADMVDLIRLARIDTYLTFIP